MNQASREVAAAPHLGPVAVNERDPPEVVRVYEESSLPMFSHQLGAEYRWLYSRTFLLCEAASVSSAANIESGRVAGYVFGVTSLASYHRTFVRTASLPMIGIILAALKRRPSLAGGLVMRSFQVHSNALKRRHGTPPANSPGR